MLDFAWFFSHKIARSKSNKNLSKLIIRIGQIAVTLGIVVSLITISIGVGSKKAIKQKMSDFNGHIVIKPYTVNNSFNSSPLYLDSLNYQSLLENPKIESHQFFAELSAVIRNTESFEGVVSKGLSHNYDQERFSDFLVKGTLPNYKKGELSNEIMISENIANHLKLDIDSSFVAYFVREGKEPIYRRFSIKGIFSTEIKDIDQNYMICDLQHIQRINKWSPNTVGGIELFVPDIEKVDEVLVSLQPENYYEYQFSTASQRFANISEWVSLFDYNIWIITIMMLIVVSINMMMVLVILIIERTHSIGVLKTLGANNSQIQTIFIQYALQIMIPGILIGNFIALSFLLTQKFTQFIKLNPENYFVSSVPVYLDFGFILGVSLGALFISALVLIIPSLIVSRINPIQAIKFN